MSEYSSLKATINANIKANNNQEITGSVMNSVLNAMVNTLGAGYQFAGVATIETNPGTPDAKMFYIANGKGTYTNFGGLVVTEDDVVVLYWDSSWHKVSTGIASLEKLTELESNVKGLDNEALKTLEAVENQEYIQVTIDSEDKILEGITAEGDKEINTNVKINGNKFDFNGARLFYSDNKEWLRVYTDSEDNVIFGIKKNGDISFPAGIPTEIVDYVEKLTHYGDTVVARNKDKESAVVQAMYHGRTNSKSKNFTFVWGSDFHGSEKSLRNMFEYGEYYNNILFSLNTGDIQEISPISDNILTKASKGITKPILNVIGNHDNGFGLNAEQIATAKEKYDRFILPFAKQSGIIQPNDLSDFPCYYYKDFNYFGIRIIVVDVYEAPKITYNGGTQIANQDSPCISEKQANFIGNALLGLPDNYGVIIAMHLADSYPTEIINNAFTDTSILGTSYIDCGIEMDSPIIKNIVDAFVNKTHLKQTYTFTGTVYDCLADNSLPTSYNIDFDFSNRTNSEFICYLMGHQHKDICTKASTDLLALYVINGGTGDRDQSFSDMARLTTGVTQDSFNVVSINREDRKVSLVRIGSNITLDLTERKMISLNY